MSYLTIYPDNDPLHPIFQTSCHDEIRQALSFVGIPFQSWSTEHPIPEDATENDILRAYAGAITRLKNEKGYRAQDVIRLFPDHPQKEALRAKFLSEHTHSEDEVRFFVEGAGLFTLHIQDKVYSVLCEAGDLISVPQGTRHWFDMGEDPNFTVIRLFTNPEGWVADYTQSSIALEFPKFGEVDS